MITQGSNNFKHYFWTYVHLFFLIVNFELF